MKELKDYIHLYIGCNVVVLGKDIVKLMGVHDHGVWLDGKYAHEGYYDFKDVKPILRKLEDMSEEEDQAFNLINRGNWIDMHWYPEGFLWLISHGFDLFNLIPEGLAIDSKTLNNPDPRDLGLDDSWIHDVDMGAKS